MKTTELEKGTLYFEVSQNAYIVSDGKTYTRYGTWSMAQEALGIDRTNQVQEIWELED